MVDITWELYLGGSNMFQLLSRTPVQADAHDQRHGKWDAKPLRAWKITRDNRGIGGKHV